ncbi:hypothetical protein [Pseudosulfitobacter koreensis]|uniref:Uncharacterized protein n=1 Tax=Pseudosulfitobacter koreensis TaxID=2968472 RepID=A0ABT1YXU9_9RHOB|nr:hypothetical protein [Pseudosulfitobacter koreense]MCR8825703.1 hypothetical protein [Pseudosulfitobacter koreense]
MIDNTDLFIFYLRRHLEVLDAEIADILSKIDASDNPEGNGYYDSGEYFMGAGLAAVQKYMTETFYFFDVDQKKALDAGPKLAGGVSFANVVWSAANYWKHDAEWWEGALEAGPQDSDGMSPISISWPIGGKSKSSVAFLEGSGRFGHDYICSIVLAALVNGAEDVRLQLVLPYLESWRADVKQMAVGNF